MRFLLSALLLTPCIWADLIVNNGTPITIPDQACSPFCRELTSSVGSGSFHLFSDSTLTEIQFWTFQLPGAYNGGTLNWQIAANSGFVDPVLGSGTFTLSQQMVRDDIKVAGFGPMFEYENVLSIDNLAIHPAAGQTFSFSIWDTSEVDKLGIFWATSGPNSPAFQIDGTSDGPISPQPEPATFWPLATGLACVVAYRMRLRKRKPAADIPTC